MDHDIGEVADRPKGCRRLIVALDVSSVVEARQVVRELYGRVGGFKVGLELITAVGSGAAIDAAGIDGDRVFHDGKFHDIPNTMAGAARSVARLGAWMFTIHASAGEDGMRAAVEAGRPSLAVAVTVLTSLDRESARSIYGRGPDEAVPALAQSACRAGAHGVVCSPRELAAVCGDPVLGGLVTVVPGVRPAWAGADDQKRVMTPGEAVRAGATYLVIGRPILRPPSSVGSRIGAVEAIVREIEEAEAC